MTTDSTQEHRSGSPDRPEPGDEPTDIDHVLQSLVASANSERGYRLGITLYVGGSVIAGELVGGEDFFEAVLADMFHDEIPPDLPPNTIAKWFKELGQGYESATGKPMTTWPEFIHLINARVYTPEGSLPGMGSVLWRGRLRRVDAFHMGRLSAPNQREPEPSSDQDIGDD